jgi:hypothetical protein
LSAGASESVDERMEEFELIHLEAFKKGYTDTSLLNSYTLLIQTALESNQTGEIEDILSSLLSVCEGVVNNGPDEQSFVDYLSGERRDIIGKCLSDTIQHIDTIVNESEVSDESSRRTSRNAIKRIDIILVNIFEKLREFDGNADVPGIKQNILKQLQSSISSAAPSIYKEDPVVGKNLAMSAIEISLHRGQKSSQFLDEITKEADKQQTVSDMIEDLNSSEPQKYFQQLNVDETEINNFSQELASDLE